MGGGLCRFGCRGLPGRDGGTGTGNGACMRAGCGLWRFGIRRDFAASNDFVIFVFKFLMNLFGAFIPFFAAPFKQHFKGDQKQ
ncbi:hypothetical protein THS27_10975 [Thalassospira sp. MCCC 1A01428]|nr:hypothetical protein THS27_10975 [Thalassospira sp. MCCC 1A01428]